MNQHETPGVGGGSRRAALRVEATQTAHLAGQVQGGYVNPSNKKPTLPVDHDQSAALWAIVSCLDVLCRRSCGTADTCSITQFSIERSLIPCYPFTSAVVLVLVSVVLADCVVFRALLSQIVALRPFTLRRLLAPYPGLMWLASLARLMRLCLTPWR